jgi:hypothetical protein
MDAIRLLFTSLGSSTVQRHACTGSRCACACSEAGFSSQNGDRAWGYTTEKQRSVVRFCGQKVSMQRMPIKKCFLFTVGSVCRVKRFTTGWQTFRWWRRGWNGGAEVVETTVKSFLCCGFRCTRKATRKIYQYWWRICREINVFPVLNIIYVLYPFVTCLLTLPCTLCNLNCNFIF